MPMNYLKYWKDAKKQFEQKTGKKKPSEVKSLFNRSTGLENACKALDDSLAKRDIPAMDKAQEGFKAAMTSYSKVLKQSETDDDDFNDELDELDHTLKLIDHYFESDRENRYTPSRPWVNRKDNARHQRALQRA